MPPTTAASAPSPWRRRMKQWAWLFPWLTFGAIWVGELYIVQGRTLAPDYQGGPRFAAYATKIRFALDVLFVATFVSLLGRRLLALAALACGVLSLVLLTYYSYFYRPLSLANVLNNWKEGLKVGTFSWAYVDTGVLLAVLAAVAAQFAALYFANQRARLRPRIALAAACLLGYLGLSIVANHYDPLQRIAVKRTLGRLGIIRGYSGPWLAEFYYSGSEELLKALAERAQLKSDQLTPVEFPLPMRKRLIVIQAESLDNSVLGFRVNGREVAPFLSRLRDQALYYRVKAFHYQGSHDADFTMLSGVAASPVANPYNMVGYKWPQTLPQVLKAAGYRSVALHGNYSEFYNRGRAYTRMGFDKQLFRENLEREYGAVADPFGIPDADVLRISAHRLRERTEPVCHFIITLTSHTPYSFVAPRADDPCPHPRNMAERYFNSIRYLDDSLRDYIVSLKDATVVIYADHCTEVRTDSFHPDRDGQTEFIPVFMYDSEQNLDPLQRTNDIAVDGTLNLLDVTSFLRNRLHQMADAAPTQATPN